MSQRGSFFLRAHGRPWPATVAAIAVAAAALVLVSWGAGWSDVGHAFAAFRPPWLALCAGAQAVAVVAYAVAYQSVAHAQPGPRLWFGLTLRIVAAGFGAFAVGGGFALDQRALHAADETSRDALARVLGLGALEYAVLAPAACIAAIALLAQGGGGVRPSVLWPWAIAVPLGFAVGLGAVARGAGRRLRPGRLRAAVDGIVLLLGLLRHPLRHWAAWLGMAAFWAAEVASLYGALRLFGVHLGAGATIVAYATGYALTRRALPLGGAGVTEAFMSVALMWAGVPLARAVPAVLAYRVANLVAPIPASVRAQRAIHPMLEKAEARRETEAG